MIDELVQKLISAARDKGLTLTLKASESKDQDGKTAVMLKFDRPNWKKDELSTPFKEWFWKEYKGGTVVAERKVVTVKFVV